MKSYFTSSQNMWQLLFCKSWSSEFWKVNRMITVSELYNNKAFRNLFITLFHHETDFYLIVTQLIKKLPACLVWNPEFHHSVHKFPPLDPILSLLRSVRTLTPFSLTHTFILFSHLCLSLPSSLVHLGFPNKVLQLSSPPPRACYTSLPT
jgi:hypothetical protein